VLFASVKVTLFVAFTFLFLSAASEQAEGGGDEGGGERETRHPPTLPGWVKALLEGEATVEEPAVSLPTGAGSR